MTYTQSAPVPDGKRAKLSTEPEPVHIRDTGLALRIWQPTALVSINFGVLDTLMRDMWLSAEATKVKVYGKVHALPRQVAAFGDDGITYSYSGSTITAAPWFPELSNIKCAVEQYVGTTFNYCLANRYNDGSHNIGPHRDDERDLDRDAPIASVSLGAPRDFVLTRIDPVTGERKRHVIALTHGTLLTMDPPTNEHWKHAVPKRKKVKCPRINFTFRKIRVSGGD